MPKLAGLRRFALVAVPVVVMMSVALVEPADATSAATTSAQAPQLQPWKLDATFPGQFKSVACLDASRCIAVGADGYVAQTHDGGDTWKTQQIPTLIRGISVVACNTTCIAIGDGPNGPLSVRSTGSVDEWIGSAPVNGLQSVAAASCGTQTSCVAVGSGSGSYPHVGAASWTSDGGRTWMAATLPSGTIGLGDVSCRAQLCVATGFDLGALLSVLVVSTDGGRTWMERSDFTKVFGYGSVDCTDSQHCIVLTISGLQQTVTVTNDGGATWTTRPSNWVVGGALSCSDPLHCWSIGAPSAAVTTDGGLTWSSQNVPGPVNTGLIDIACPSSTTCVAVGEIANVADEIANTHDGGSTWTRRATPVSVPAEAFAIACGPGTTTCWASAGSTLVGTNDGHRWRAVHLDDSDFIEGISCADAVHCWAVGNSIWATSDGGTTWVKHQIDTPPGNPLTDTSCVDAQHCVAVGYGQIYVTDDGGAHWTNRPTPDGDLFFDIACTSATHCVAEGSTSAVTDDGGVTWTTHALPADFGFAEDVTCADAGHCWALGSNAIAFSSDGGTTWTSQGTITNVSRPSRLACLDASTCVVIGADATGNLTIGATTDGGRTWMPQSPPAEIGALTDVACSTAIGCVASGQVGNSSIPLGFGAGIIRMPPPH